MFLFLPFFWKGCCLRCWRSLSWPSLSSRLPKRACFFLFFRIFGGGFVSDSCLDAACLALGCLSFLVFLVECVCACFFCSCCRSCFSQCRVPWLLPQAKRHASYLGVGTYRPQPAHASLRWRSAAVAFWFAIARAKPGGICFRGVCSLRMRLAVGDQCVLAALRSCAHLWSLQEVLCSFELHPL